MEIIGAKQAILNRSRADSRHIAVRAFPEGSELDKTERVVGRPG
jgi:hypothetical protein